MEHLIGLDVVMAIMVVVTLTSKLIFESDYSAIAIVMLFLLGTQFLVNARYFYPKSRELY
ncbi:hypothetical protein [Virgibacillus senegalensis]|uniref:hypothetical protein n=1 Tax=Virgibacillus senegalensis TaxID=1499679 RepID=UPI00069E9195|nr:hypothetical protein [Virgibacillus senegalensis]